MKKHLQLFAMLLLISAVAKAQHNVIIDPDIQNGNISVDPANPIEVEVPVIITATPYVYYDLVGFTAYENGNPDNVITVPNLGNVGTFHMPDFDVFVTATFRRQAPIINGNIEAPAAIHPGEALDLTPPEVINADNEGWEISNDSFISIVTYTNQPLGLEYNDWELRYMASNESDTVYSNVVNITVNDYPKLVIDNTIENGTISASPEGNIPAGETITITDNPDYGYELSSLWYYKTDAPDQTVMIFNKEFSMPDFDVTVSATFIKKKHNVSKYPGILHGDIQIEPLGQVEVNTIVEVTAIPDEDYVLDSVFYFINTTSQSVKIENGSFIMPDYDVTVSAFFSDMYHEIDVLPSIHGTVNVFPERAMKDDTVYIYIIPDSNYVLQHLEVYYVNFWGQHQQIAISEDANERYFIMPDHDVKVSATFELMQMPIIVTDIDIPEAICAGDSLELTPPQVINNPSDQGWQLSNDGFNEVIEAYNHQALGVEYNGWELRYMASNDSGIVYSNTVTITVHGLENVKLEGDNVVNNGQKGEYLVIGADNSSCIWMVSDELATIEDTGNLCKVIWKTNGTQQVTVIVVDNIYGCSDTLIIDVEVLSCIDEDDINEIIGKTNANDTEYILLYPNPKDEYKYQWYKDNEPIPGANKQYYYEQGGLRAGTYKVFISFTEDGICGAFSAEYQVNNDGLLSNRLTIYPNPSYVNDDLFVEIENERDAQLSIYSVDGRLVHSQMVTGSLATIDIRLPQGVYVAYLFNETGFVKTEKIVIQ